MKRNAVSLIKIGFFSLLGVIILAYSLFQASKILIGPVITIYTPESGAVYNSTLIAIEGRAKNVAYINLNGRKMFTDTSGYFSEKLLLSPGYNIIMLDARDKFGSRTEKKLELILKE